MNNKQLTVGSLFSGIGGLELGLERAGMQVTWQVELNEYASKILAKHWPNVHRERDIRECGGHNLAAVDLICGGFPCQDISNAGERAGITGERSGLWSEFARIIGELRPRYVVVENVAALLQRGMGRVLGELAALGYDAEWHCIQAADAGAPHLRDRVFILAYANSAEWRPQPKAWYEPNGHDARRQEATGRSTVCSEAGSAQTLAYANSTRLPQWDEQGIATAAPRRIITRRELERVHTTTGRQQWETEPAVGRVADGVPRRVDRLRRLGNAVVPQVAELIGRHITHIDEADQYRTNWRRVAEQGG